jgi:hypothetical protein
VKIKYRLEKWENALVFQVLEMDERFRSGNKGANSHRRPSRYNVTSYCAPSIIGSEVVHLRGSDKSMDLYISTHTFSSNKERDEYFDEIQDALADWAANWEGWREGEEVEAKEKGVFVL